MANYCLKWTLFSLPYTYFFLFILQEEVAHEFIEEAFIENEEGYARYCCAIVHNAALYLPDFLEYLGSEHSNMPVKHGIIGKLNI